MRLKIQEHQDKLLVLFANLKSCQYWEMAQKFGNYRWVQEGFLDGRTEGVVVGRILFAVIGPVDFCLQGNFSGEIFGKIIQFRNSRFIDDPLAADVLGDFSIPQIGKVSLISFDPHPLLEPHPYIEWFSVNDVHYRIELAKEDARIVEDHEINALDEACRSIRTHLLPCLERSSS